MKTKRFKMSAISSAVSACLLGGVGVFVQAQGNPSGLQEEELVVTGIRASLQRAMDLKRDARGVVDAISAEDIGKFPDTNLAESLQRISGVSIDRDNNEGSRVTVRGFGPEFNLVTLNGRQMPTSLVDDTASRSFDFGDLAAESVSGVEVHKTFSADNVSGGIGSLINIRTARPLEKPGLTASIGAKAVMDSTNEVGDDVTPEISGIFSQTFANDTVGVALSASYQERDSRAVTADIANWRNNLDGVDLSLVEDNRSDPNGNFYYPRNFGYGIDDISRERTNAQSVFQYKPVENVTATLDYTYSKVDYRALNTGVGIWYSDTGAALTDGVIDENGTFVMVTEAGEDYASNMRLNTSETENKSLGFNVEWSASDNLEVSFDIHDSSSERGGVDRGNDAFHILGARQIDLKTYDARDGNDIPDMTIDFVDDGIGIIDGLPTAASYDSLFGQAGLDRNLSEITQFQFKGTWSTGQTTGITDIDFGYANTETRNRWRSYNTNQLAAGWYGGNQDLWPEDMFSTESLLGLTPSFSGGNSNIPIYHTWDFERGIAIAEAEWNIPGGSARPWAFAQGVVMRPDLTGDPVFDHTVTEKINSLYLQFTSAGELAAMPLTVTAGVRYEQTNIIANSFQQDPAEMVWRNPTEWGINLASESRYTHEKGDYGAWLPGLDASLNISDDLIARFSYSQSITRPALREMTGTTSVTFRPKPGEREGAVGNPDLLPYTSNNLDLSLEWYYADASYVSLGLFAKQVNNFIVNQFVSTEVFNLRDPSQGPRAQQAEQDLIDAGMDVTDVNLFNQINTNLGLGNTEITQTGDDPLALFEISTPLNMENAQLQGLELAVQHSFADTGFGVIANLTMVGGDLEVDPSSIDFQFALPGLSDSANLVGFYDKHGLQVRLAYNWRDTFLNGIGENNTPYYTEKFGQLDGMISYELPFVDGMTIFAEGINLTSESQRIYARYTNQFKTATQYGARYNFGVRYTF